MRWSIWEALVMPWSARKGRKMRLSTEIAVIDRLEAQSARLHVCEVVAHRALEGTRTDWGDDCEFLCSPASHGTYSCRVNEAVLPPLSPVTVRPRTSLVKYAYKRPFDLDLPLLLRRPGAAFASHAPKAGALPLRHAPTPTDLNGHALPRATTRLER